MKCPRCQQDNPSAANFCMKCGTRLNGIDNGPYEERPQEVQHLTRALREALEQQTATSEILRVISSSPTDVQPVLDAIVESGTKLCDAAFGSAFRFDGHVMTFVAHHNMTPGELEITRGVFPRRATRDTAAGRAVVERRIIHIPDLREDPEYGIRWVQQALGYHTVLAVPMLRDGEAIGVLNFWRREVRPFADKQIALRDDICRSSSHCHRERTLVQGVGSAQSRSHRGTGAADRDERDPPRWLWSSRRRPASCSR